MKFKIVLFVLFSAIQIIAAQDRPPDAQPGKCYAKCLIPEQIDTVYLGGENPERKTVIKRMPGGFSEWREVLCGDKIRPHTLRKIQESLFAFGYYTGVLDGDMNAATKAALTKFQKEKGLPIGNLDLKTLDALDVSY